MHGRELFQNLRISNLDIRVILSKMRWGVSRDVLNEIQHLKIEPFFPTLDAYIVPLTSNEITTFQKRLPSIKYLDSADISLLTIALRDGDVVLSDDGGLIAECDALHIPYFKLPTFLLNLVVNNQLSKRDAYRAYRFWEKEGRYNLQEIKKVKEALQKL